jgi:hypothetical protein
MSLSDIPTALAAIAAVLGPHRLHAMSPARAMIAASPNHIHARLSSDRRARSGTPSRRNIKV